MGLDNSINVVPKTARAWDWLKSFVKEVEPDMDVYTTKSGIRKVYQFAYWRKYYNIRSAMLDTFKDKDYDGQGGEMYFDSEADIEDVIGILKYFLDENNWDEYSQNGPGWSNGCIWEWHIAIKTLARQIFILREFLLALEWERLDAADPITINDFEIFFEDSY